MIEVHATQKGYGTDVAEADDPESALLAARTLAADIRAAQGNRELVQCEFFVDGKLSVADWL